LEEPTEHLEPILTNALKLGMLTLSHPVEYAKTLIQIGHEPLPPWRTKTLLGKPALALPSVLKYIGIIRERHGLMGLYAGFSPRLLEMGAAHYANLAFAAHWPEVQEEEPLGSADLSNEEELGRIRRALFRGVANKAVLCIATHPFQVS